MSTSRGHMQQTESRTGESSRQHSNGPARGGRGGRPGRGGRGGRGGSTRGRRGQDEVSSGAETMTQGRGGSSRPRPTHFISLPIGHHAALRTRMTKFSQALLDHSPKINGLDESILVSPRRMHITLGTMNLVEEGVESLDTGHTSSNTSPQPRTIQSAVDFLHDMRPRIIQALEGKDLRVGLSILDIMRPDQGDVKQAHIMWAGPSYASENAKRLKRVADLIHNEFKAKGLVIDENRPLKLHCTIVNASYRKPRGHRQSFSYADVISSSAIQAIAQAQSESPAKTSRAVDLGEWEVDEVQICKMGSWGPEGEYVSVGKVSLHT